MAKKNGTEKSEEKRPQMLHIRLCPEAHKVLEEIAIVDRRSLTQMGQYILESVLLQLQLKITFPSKEDKK